MASGIVESVNENPDGQQQQQQQGVSRSKMVQRLLSASSNLPQFLQDLLTLQAVTVAGTEAAGFLLEREGENFSLKTAAHVRPDQASAEIRAQAITAFQEIVRPCVAQNKDGAIEIGPTGQGSSEMQFCLVTLLRSEAQVVGVTAVITRCLDTERAKQRLNSMQLIAGYFELYSLRRTSENSRMIAQSHQHVLQLATSVATGEGFEAAAQSLCNELATRTGAARVSLGWMKGRNIKVVALSHTEKFDKKQELITQLERVMEECADQEAPVQFDPAGTGTQNVSREAQMLSRAQGGNTVLSLPLRRRDEIEGVATLEFLPQHKLSDNAAQGLTIAVDLLAPQLYDRYENDRWLITKAGISTKNVARMAVGKQHWVAKLVTAGVIGAVAFICIYKMDYNVKAPFTFVAEEKRTISAPFEGQVIETMVRPGDEVKPGQVLLKMDSYDFKNKRGQALAEVARTEGEMNNFRDKPDKQGEYVVAEAERDKALKEVEFYDKKIKDSEIKSQIAGKVLSGDWHEKINVPVKYGETLFEIGDVKTLRPELTVADRDVQWLSVGQHGKLATTALPGEKYPFVLETVVPKGEAKEGENIFVVKAVLDRDSKDWIGDGHADGWLPGLGGEARVGVGKKPIIWVWTHRLIEFLRLKLWM